MLLRGSVVWETAHEALKWFKLKDAQNKRVLTQGVQVAITSASDMCSARFAALKTVVKPRQRQGQRKAVIPQKPFWAEGWRSNCGGGA